MTSTPSTDPADEPGATHARGVSLAVALVGLLLVVGQTCAACGDTQGPADADAGPVDASMDSGAPDTGDSAADSAVDSAERPDVGPSDPDFVVPAVLPTGCDPRIARHPERIAPLTWSPCEDVDGCQALDITWGDPLARGTMAVAYTLAPGWGTTPVLGLVRPVEDRFELVAFAPSGTVQFAVRYQSGVDFCSAGIGTSIANGKIAFSTTFPERYLPVASIVLSGAPNMPDALRLVELDEPTIGNSSVQRLALGPTGVIAFEIIPALRVASLRDGEFRILPREASTQSPVVVGDTVLFMENTSPRRYLSETADLAVAPYLARADADVMFLVADGEWIAWMEGRDRIDSSTHWARRTVYAARFTEDPAMLMPQLVTELGEGFPTRLRVGGGWVVSGHPTDYPRRMVATELSSGRQVTFSAPEGEDLLPLYVTEEEVAFRVRHAISHINRTIWRMALPPAE